MNKNRPIYRLKGLGLGSIGQAKIGIYTDKGLGLGSIGDRSK